jgi:hypothetical protein
MVPFSLGCVIVWRQRLEVVIQNLVYIGLARQLNQLWALPVSREKQKEKTWGVDLTCFSCSMRSCSLYTSRMRGRGMVSGKTGPLSAPPSLLAAGP